MRIASLAGKKAAVIGCGGLGCNILVHLAGAGIGGLSLCDPDVVDASNLDRQFLYRPADIGRPKAECAAAALAAYAPAVEISVFQKRIEKPGDLAFAAACDILFLAVDNNVPREAAQRFAGDTGIPLVNGGVNGAYGAAYLYLPRQTPCLSCAGLLEPEKAAPDSLSPVVGVIGALCADLGAAYLDTMDPAIAGSLYVYDSFTVSRLPVRPEPGCGICREI